MHGPHPRQTMVVNPLRSTILKIPGLHGLSNSGQHSGHKDGPFCMGDMMPWLHDAGKGLVLSSLNMVTVSLRFIEVVAEGDFRTMFLRGCRPWFQTMAL